MSTTKADELMNEGDRRVKGGFWWIFLSKDERYNDAVEYYGKAANLYKKNKQWHKAITAYQKFADLKKQLDQGFNGATALINMANIYHHQLGDDKNTMNTLQNAIELYKEHGNFTTAAKYMIELAELHDNDDNQDLAIKLYAEAADIYEEERNQSAASKCLVKVADYSIQNGDYTKAIEIYQKLANTSAKNRILVFSAREYAMKAILLLLCNNDVITANQFLNQYSKIDPNFESYSEYELLFNVITSFEQNDTEQFVQFIQNYDKIKRLNHWQVNILNIIKKKMESSYDINGLA